MTIEDTLDQYCTAWSTADAAQRAAFDDIIVDEDLVLRKPQLALVEARINAARAQLADVVPAG